MKNKQMHWGQILEMVDIGGKVARLQCIQIGKASLMNSDGG